MFHGAFANSTGVVLVVSQFHGLWYRFYVFPHLVKNDCADKGVLNSTREKERRGVLHQSSHDVGPPALEDVVVVSSGTSADVVHLCQIGNVVVVMMVICVMVT